MTSEGIIHFCSTFIWPIRFCLFCFYFSCWKEKKDAKIFVNTAYCKITLINSFILVWLDTDVTYVDWLVIFVYIQYNLDFSMSAIRQSHCFKKSTETTVNPFLLHSFSQVKSFLFGWAIKDICVLHWTQYIHQIVKMLSSKTRESFRKYFFG